MAVSGAQGASARNVATRASASASSINYHFGSIEQLYGSSQRRAIQQADSWLDSRLTDAAAGAPWPTEAFPAFAAEMIDAWVDTRRVEAQAEACDLMSRSRVPSDTVPLWIDLWDQFWVQLLPLFTLDPEHAPIVSSILQSERLAHLARWRWPHDRAGLEEVCVRLVARLSGDASLLARASPWRSGAERLTQQETGFPPLTGAAARIAQAVVAAVDEDGEEGLTHRAAAKRAGLSLGAVTHHFPTRSALTAAGYACLYQRLVDAAQGPGGRTAEHGDLGLHLSSMLDISAGAPGAGAFELFFLAATRDEALTPFAARVRYSRGLNTLRFLTPVAPDLTRLDGVLLSHWILSVGRSANAGHQRQDEAVRQFSHWAKVLFSRD